MPTGKHKSRTLRRVFRKTPGSRTVMHYRVRKPQPARCAVCKKILLGVPRDLHYKVRRMPKSQKRPERPFGGNMCSACLRRKIISESRLMGN